MDYFPKAEWQWVFNFSEGKLSLVDRERSLPLVYKKNMLRLTETQSISFSVEDVTRYIELFESQSLSDFDEPLRCKIILHLIAIELFHKPIMPKSWLFQTSDNPQTRFENGELATLVTAGVPVSATYMVLEQQDNFCLCMLFDEYHEFPNNRTFKQFQVIKVTADKLRRYQTSQSQEWLSFQNAG